MAHKISVCWLVNTVAYTMPALVIVVGLLAYLEIGVQSLGTFLVLFGFLLYGLEILAKFFAKNSEASQDPLRFR